MPTRIKQGEDYLLRATISENGTPVNIIAANIEEVYATIIVNGIEQSKHALVNSANFEVMEYDSTGAGDGSDGKVQIPLTRDFTKNYPTGYVDVIFLAKFTDAAFVGGRHEEYPLKKVLQVIPGAPDGNLDIENT